MFSAMFLSENRKRPRRGRKIQKNLISPRLIANVLIEFFLERRFACDTDHLVRYIPILEKDQRRNAHDIESAGDVRIFVGVELPENYLPIVIAVELFDYRSDHLAWAAPGRPEIDNHRLVFR